MITRKSLFESSILKVEFFRIRYMDFSRISIKLLEANNRIFSKIPSSNLKQFLLNCASFIQGQFWQRVDNLYDESELYHIVLFQTGELYV